MSPSTVRNVSCISLNCCSLASYLVWGFSYGTVVGQYMVKVLPPERLGRIVIDGVVNAAIWNEHATSIWDREYFLHELFFRTLTGSEHHRGFTRY